MMIALHARDVLDNRSFLFLLPTGMEFQSINPKDGTVIASYRVMGEDEVASIVEASHAAGKGWGITSIPERQAALNRLADLLERHQSTLAQLMTDEMGKVLYESKAEVKKCAQCCRYFAEHAPQLLRPKETPTEAIRSYLMLAPLGVILGIMPWNFPLWQVMRFAIPTLLVGNGVLLKHADNVFGCALALEDLFAQAGFPENLFRILLIETSHIEAVIAHPAVEGVALTGSERAGRAVSRIAGAHLKPAVMELGGSDPYIILDDADLDLAVRCCAQSRFRNAGQVCIAAKRIIVTPGIYDDFLDTLTDIVDGISCGDPYVDTMTMGPMARDDLRHNLQRQVQDSVAMGARVIRGGDIIDGPGYFFQPTLIAEVDETMPLFTQETFGPVAVVCAARDESHAIELANASRYGLGASVFSSDLDRAERIARDEIECGAGFVNAVVKSEPAIPFGGVKASGFGRELGSSGIRAFANLKHVYVD